MKVKNLGIQLLACGANNQYDSDIDQEGKAKN
jgi:hypothetical protein